MHHLAYLIETGLNLYTQKNQRRSRSLTQGFGFMRQDRQVAMGYIRAAKDYEDPRAAIDYLDQLDAAELGTGGLFYIYQVIYNYLCFLQNPSKPEGFKAMIAEVHKQVKESAKSLFGNLDQEFLNGFDTFVALAHKKIDEGVPVGAEQKIQLVGPGVQTTFASRAVPDLATEALAELNQQVRTLSEQVALEMQINQALSERTEQTQQKLVEAKERQQQTAKQLRDQEAENRVLRREKLALETTSQQKISQQEARAHQQVKDLQRAVEQATQDKQQLTKELALEKQIAAEQMQRASQAEGHAESAGALQTAYSEQLEQITVRAEASRREILALRAEVAEQKAGKVTAQEMVTDQSAQLEKLERVQQELEREKALEQQLNNELQKNIEKAEQRIDEMKQQTAQQETALRRLEKTNQQLQRESLQANTRSKELEGQLEATTTTVARLKEELDAIGNENKALEAAFAAVQERGAQLAETVTETMARTQQSVEKQREQVAEQQQENATLRRTVLALQEENRLLRGDATADKQQIDRLSLENLDRKRALEALQQEVESVYRFEDAELERVTLIDIAKLLTLLQDDMKFSYYYERVREVCGQNIRFAKHLEKAQHVFDTLKDVYKPLFDPALRTDQRTDLSAEEIAEVVEGERQTMLMLFDEVESQRRQGEAMKQLRMQASTLEDAGFKAHVGAVGFEQEVYSDFCAEAIKRIENCTKFVEASNSSSVLEDLNKRCRGNYDVEDEQGESHKRLRREGFIDRNLTKLIAEATRLHQKSPEYAEQITSEMFNSDRLFADLYEELKAVFSEDEEKLTLIEQVFGTLQTLYTPIFSGTDKTLEEQLAEHGAYREAIEALKPLLDQPRRQDHPEERTWQEGLWCQFCEESVKRIQRFDEIPFFLNQRRLVRFASNNKVALAKYADSRYRLTDSYKLKTLAGFKEGDRRLAYLEDALMQAYAKRKGPLQAVSAICKEITALYDLVFYSSTAAENVNLLSSQYNEHTKTIQEKMINVAGKLKVLKNQMGWDKQLRNQATRPLSKNGQIMEAFIEEVETRIENHKSGRVRAFTHNHVNKAFALKNAVVLDERAECRFQDWQRQKGFEPTTVAGDFQVVAVTRHLSTIGAPST